MESEWYYADSDNNKHPATHADLESKLNSGELRPDVMVWKTGMTDWILAKEHADLKNSICRSDGPPPLPKTSKKTEPIDPWHIETAPCPECGRSCSKLAIACPFCLHELEGGEGGKQIAGDKKKLAGEIAGSVADAAVKTLLSPMMALSLCVGKSIGKKTIHGARSGSEKRNIKRLVERLSAIDCLASGNVQMGMGSVSGLNCVVLITKSDFFITHIGYPGNNPDTKISRDAMLKVSVTQTPEGKKAYGMVAYAKITYEYIEKNTGGETDMSMWFSGPGAQETATRTAQIANQYIVKSRSKTLKNIPPTQIQEGQRLTREYAAEFEGKQKPQDKAKTPPRTKTQECPSAKSDSGRVSAEQGYAIAQRQLGMSYYEGDGVPKDVVKAYAWLSLAADQGDCLAISARLETTKNMTPIQIGAGYRLAQEYAAKQKPQDKAKNPPRTKT